MCLLLLLDPGCGEYLCCIPQPENQGQWRPFQSQIGVFGIKDSIAGQEVPKGPVLIYTNIPKTTCRSPKSSNRLKVIATVCGSSTTDLANGQCISPPTMCQSSAPIESRLPGLPPRVEFFRQTPDSAASPASDGLPRTVPAARDGAILPDSLQTHPGKSTCI